MRRLVAAVVLVVGVGLLTACGALLNSVQQGAAAGLQSFIANQFSNKLLAAVDGVMAGLAAPGGFLNDPLVKILLPPPLGMLIGTAQAMRENPEAALLETLINQAAEKSIPFVGPIVTQAILNMDADTLQAVLHGDAGAATAYLKAEASSALKAAVLPEITRQMEANGALALYDTLTDAQAQTHAQVQEQAAKVQAGVEAAEQLKSAPGPAVAEALAGQVPPAVGTSVVPQVEAPAGLSAQRLGEYVAEKAVDGFFRKFGQQEADIHRSLAPAL